jgi:hypothetical protein
VAIAVLNQHGFSDAGPVGHLALIGASEGNVSRVEGRRAAGPLPNANWAPQRVLTEHPQKTSVFH